MGIVRKHILYILVAFTTAARKLICVNPGKRYPFNPSKHQSFMVVSWAVLLLLFLTPTVRAIGEDDSLRPFGAEPSGSYTNTVNFNVAAQTYEFCYTSTDSNITYIVSILSGDVLNGMLHIGAQINDEAVVYPIIKGGTFYRNLSGDVISPSSLANFATVSLDSHNLIDNKVVLVYSETLDNITTSKTYEFWIEGKTLFIRIFDPANAESGPVAGYGYYAGVSCGRTENTVGAKSITLPYSLDPIIYLPEGRFISTYADRSLSSSYDFNLQDWKYSDSSIFASHHAINILDSADNVAPLEETIYVTLSDKALDTIARPNNPPSPYRQQLVDRVVLDVWFIETLFESEEQCAVARDWQSPSAGTAQISGNASDLPGECGDGVILRIRHNNSEVWSERIENGDLQGSNFDLSLTISEGDLLSFRIEPGKNDLCDATAFVCNIELNEQTYDSAVDFRSSQGYRGWYYREYNIYDVASDLVWTVDHWHGKGQYTSIRQNNQHPPDSGNRFLQGKVMLEQYNEYGMSELLVLYHSWQHYGYDVGLPTHYPPNEDYGGTEAMRLLTDTADNLGMLFALHENYIDIYPDNPPDFPNPNYNPDAIAKWADLSFKEAWYNESTGQQAYLIACDKAKAIAAAESHKIEADFNPSATFLDVSTGVRPKHSLDLDASNPTAKTYSESVRQNKELFGQQRSIYGGPLLGEGCEGTNRYDSFFAGYVDGVERQVDGRLNAPIIPDFEIFAVQPLMVNHGMGLPSRFFVGVGQESIDPDEANWYRYRAFEIAFGHAGFLGEGFDFESLDFPLVYYHFPEYYLMQATQSRYLNASAQQVLYWSGAEYMTLSEALIQEYDFQTARVHISYDNDTNVIVNCNNDTIRNSNADFDNQQGSFGWKYLEWNSGHYQEMVWDSGNNFWQGSTYWCRNYFWGMHPDATEPVRRWVCPVNNVLVHVSVSVDRVDTNGDGVDIEIYRNGKDIGSIQWSRTLLAGQKASHNFEITLQENDSLDFHVGQRSSSSYDTTLFDITISYKMLGSENWVISTPHGTFTLPSMGWIVWNESDDFLALSVLDTTDPNRRVEYVNSSEYDFLRSPDSNSLYYNGLTTDGMLAVNHNGWGIYRNLHLVHGTFATSDDAPYGLVQLSQQGDININYQNQCNFILTVRNLSTSSVDITYADFPGSWRNVDGTVRSDITVRLLGSKGIPTNQVVDWNCSGDGTVLNINNITNNSSYLISFPITGDISGDCCVNIVDLAILAQQWLKSPSEPSADIALPHDNMVNFLDFAVLADNWWCCTKTIIADLTNDGIVNFKDFAKLAYFWLQDESSVDIAPPPIGDGIVDTQDLAVLSQYWLKSAE